MKKIISILLTAVLAVTMLTGCNSHPASGSEEETPQVCAQLMEQLRAVSDDMACDKVVCYGEKDYATYFEYWYDMPMQFVSDGAICYVEAGDNVDEISILKPVSNVTYDTVKETLERRIERQKKHFGGLIDEQAERMDEAVIYESEGYLLFVVADDPEPIITEFTRSTSGVDAQKAD